MGQAIQKWKADDGREFDTEEEMEAHEAGVAWKDHINEFVSEHTWGRGQDTRARAIVQLYLGWRKRKGLD